MKVLCEISVGELLDKISILEIKLEKIQDIEKKELIIYEYKELIATLNKLNIDSKLLENYKKNLKAVNTKLWDVEDLLRKLESEKKFNKKFILLARSVYQLNDERYDYKNKLNNAINSNVKEVKSYQEY